jgi:hypothetical protein
MIYVTRSNTKGVKCLRVNLHLNEDNERDKLIIDMLNSKYSAAGYTKEVLYAAAKGESIISLTSKEIAIEAPEEEYEKIEGLDGIDV